MLGDGKHEFGAMRLRNRRRRLFPRELSNSLELSSTSGSPFLFEIRTAMLLSWPSGKITQTNHQKEKL